MEHELFVLPRPIPGPCTNCGGYHPQLVLTKNGSAYCLRCVGEILRVMGGDHGAVIPESAGRPER